MVNYIKTTNGYFYKICKNGKKRISEDEYNKQRKIKKMTGGIQLDTITIQNDTSHGRKIETMENVFLTGNISSFNYRTSSISKITKLLMEDLKKFKNNKKNHKNNKGLNVVYVGEINYTGDGHLQGIRGNSNIWLVNDNNKYRYIVKINKDDTYDYPYHVKCALQSLCNLENSELIINALKKFSVQLDESKINELSQKKVKFLK